MDRRIKIYLVGVLLGCILLAVMPRPFGRTERERDESRREPHGLYPIVLTDGLGREITVDQPPARLISLAPSVTEILFALGAGERLIANTRFCNYPEAALGVFKIGDMRHPDIETMVQLRPGMVVGTVLSPLSLYERMEGVGLVSVAFEHAGLEGVLSDIRILGQVVGLPGEALRLTRRIEARRDRVLAAVAARQGLKRPRVILLYDLEQLSSAGKNSWPGDFIEMCGGENIAAQAQSAWPRLSPEALVASDPEVVIFAVESDERSRRAAELAVAALPVHRFWAHTAAVRENRVVRVNKALFDVPGPRMVDALEAVAGAVHPDLFVAAR
jgi:iron complex transport system substrate-binding protein